MNNGYIKLWTGRRRHFDDPRNQAHKAFNALIQGGAAEIVKRQLIRTFDRFDNDEHCRMLLQIHDAIVFEIREDELDRYVPLIVDSMQSVEPDFGVPFTVGYNKWGEK